MLPADPVLVNPIAGQVLQALVAKVRAPLFEVATRSAMFSVVMPGHRIERHADQQVREWLCRVHVPILTNPRAELRIRDAVLHLGPAGHAFAVNAQAPHEVVNDGPSPRLHLMFDVVSR